MGTHQKLGSILQNCRKYFTSGTLLMVLALFWGGSAHATPSDSFYPTWKLLKAQQKREFVAGYLAGWKDSSKILDIATGYIQDNPSEAVASLGKIRRLYDYSTLSPEVVVSEIDAFYSNPENTSAGLPVAIAGAKDRIASLGQLKLRE